MTLLTKALQRIGKQIRRYNDAQEHPKPIPSHERHGNTSEWASVIVNTILAGLTLWAIWVSYNANETSKAALNYAKEKDKADNIEERKM